MTSPSSDQNLTLQELVETAPRIIHGARYKKQTGSLAMAELCTDIQKKLESPSERVTTDLLKTFAEAACNLCGPYGSHTIARDYSHDVFIQAANHPSANPREALDIVLRLAAQRSHVTPYALSMAWSVLEKNAAEAIPNDVEQVANLVLNPPRIYNEDSVYRLGKGILRFLLQERTDLFSPEKQEKSEAVTTCLMEDSGLAALMLEKDVDWFDSPAAEKLGRATMCFGNQRIDFFDIVRRLVGKRKDLAPSFLLVALEETSNVGHTRDEEAQKIARIVLDQAPEHADKTRPIIVKCTKASPREPSNLEPMAIENAGKYAETTQTLPDDLRDLLKRGKKETGGLVCQMSRKLLKQYGKLPRAPKTPGEKTFWRRLLPFCALS